MLITALAITAAIALAVVWLTVKQWPDRWALAWAIAMAGMTANSWMAQLWMWRAFDWESAYWRDTQELESQLKQSRQQSKSQSQGLNDAAYQSASPDFVCDVQPISGHPLIVFCDPFRLSKQASAEVLECDLFDVQVARQSNSGNSPQMAFLQHGNRRYSKYHTQTTATPTHST